MKLEQISLDQDFSKINFHSILDLRTQDKHIYVLNKILENPKLIQYVEKYLQKLYELFSTKKESTVQYFSPHVEWSWWNIIYNNRFHEIITSNSDYAIQMRQCSCFIAPELFSQEENMMFFEKWKPILVAKANDHKKLDNLI